MTDRITRRAETIRRLKALAEHPRSDATERKRAAAQAAHLSWKYGLQDASELWPHSRVVIVSHFFQVSRTSEHGPDRASALLHILRAHGLCGHILNRSRKGRTPTGAEVWGPQDVIEGLKGLVPWLLLQMEHSADEEAKTERAAARKLGYSVTAANRAVLRAKRSYLHGYGRGVGELIRERNRRTETGVQVSSRGNAALVLINRKTLTETAYAEAVAGLVPQRDVRYKIGRETYERGVQAGKRADLGGRSLSDAREKLMT